MSNKMLRPFIVKVSLLSYNRIQVYFPLVLNIVNIATFTLLYNYHF